MRRLINHRLGHDHFRAFLNTYRMAEARRLLKEAGQDEPQQGHWFIPQLDTPKR